MASRRRGRGDGGQCAVCSPPTGSLDLLGAGGDRCGTRPHPTGQWWGDGVRCEQDCENCQQMHRTPPVATSADAMDAGEGGAVTRMFLDGTKIKGKTGCREDQDRSRDGTWN